MASKRRLAPIIGPDGSGRPKGQDMHVVEIDAAFGSLLGLAEGQKVAQDTAVAVLLSDLHRRSGRPTISS